MRKILWNRVFTAIGTTVCISLAMYAYATSPTYELISYETTVSTGETLWDICSEVVSDNEDIRVVMDRAIRDNNLDRNGRIYPGMRLVIRVKSLEPLEDEK